MIGSHFFARTTGFATGAAAADGVVTAGAVSAGTVGVVAGVVSATVALLSSPPPLEISRITTTTPATSAPMAAQRPYERLRPGFRLGLVATALAVAAVLLAPSISGTDAAAALASAFDPDLGAVLRAVFGEALRVAFAGVLRADAEEDRFAGAFSFAADDFADEAEVFLAAGFLGAPLELDFGRLLGFFGVATAAHYSVAPRIRRWFPPVCKRKGGPEAAPLSVAQSLGSGALLASTLVSAALLAAVISAALLGGVAAFLDIGCGCLRCLEHPSLLSVG